MGNDGGSIPDRRDLVRNKPKAEQADKANQTRAKWAFCALSKLPLQEPVVSCALGKLYNKDSIIEYLLNKSAFGDGEDICGHIRSLKDIKTLKLTHNSAPARALDTSKTAPDRAQFVCPLTLKEMNGIQPFVYLLRCGCVFSQAGLRTVATPSPTGDTTTTSSLDCPQCTVKYNRSEDVVQLNPPVEEEEKMYEAMLRRRLQEPPKKAKKRKANAEDDGSDGKDGEFGKKKKKAASSTSPPLPGVNPNIATASRAVVSSLAAEEAKRKATMSDAVKSLYRDKNAPQKKETFMTMNTFTRYA